VWQIERGDTMFVTFGSVNAELRLRRMAQSDPLLPVAL
jgi:hypothetical protein